MPVPSHAEGIRWETYKPGMAKAKVERKKVFINFHADWCPFCKKMEVESFSQPEIIKTLSNRFIAIRGDVDKEESINPETFLTILKYIDSESYKSMTFKEYMGSQK